MKRTATTLMTALLAVLVWTSSGTALSQEGPALLVLKADSDSLSGGEKDKLLSAQKAHLAKYKKYTLMATPEVDLLDEMVNFECLEMDGDCLSKIARKHKAPWVLYTNFDGTTLKIKLVDVEAAKVTESYEVKASKRKVQSLGASQALVKVFGPLPKKKTLVAVKIDANVEKAEVFVDQKRVGTTPLELKLKEGEYTVSLRKDEFMMVENKITVTGGKAVSWKGTMKPVPKKVVKVVTPVKPVKPGDPKKDPKKDDDEVKPFYTTWWFWTAVAVGVAAVAGGTAAALSASGETSDVGTVKFSISPNAAEKDFIFYQ